MQHHFLLIAQVDGDAGQVLDGHRPSQYSTVAHVHDVFGRHDELTLLLNAILVELLDLGRENNLFFWAAVLLSYLDEGPIVFEIVWVVVALLAGVFGHATTYCRASSLL